MSPLGVTLNQTSARGAPLQGWKQARPGLVSGAKMSCCVVILPCTPQVKAFERRCRHLYGASPAAKRKRAAEEAAAQAAGVSGPCGGFIFPGAAIAIGLKNEHESIHFKRNHQYRALL